MARKQAVKKSNVLSERWRRAANEATTADAVVTYTECANELDAEIAAKRLIPSRVLVAVCEGCGAEVPMPTRNTRKVVADLPAGWSQCGVSRRRVAGSRVLAAWCPQCRTRKQSTTSAAGQEPQPKP